MESKTAKKASSLLSEIAATKAFVQILNQGAWVYAHPIEPRSRDDVHIMPTMMPTGMPILVTATEYLAGLEAELKAL